MKRWALLTLGAGLTNSVFAAWLSVCSSSGVTQMAGLLAQYSSVQGAVTSLLIGTEAMPDCASLELPISPQAISQGRLLSADFAQTLAPGFGLLGSVIDRRFRISDVVPREKKEVWHAIPAGVELSADLTARAFGVEGRAKAIAGDGPIVLECASGERPAGVVLQLPYSGLPHFISSALSIGYNTSGNFEWGVSDAHRDKSEVPLPLATLPAANATSLIDIPQANLDLTTVGSFTVACPTKSARLELHSLKIVPVRAAQRRPRALWVWQASEWMETPDALLGRLTKVGADTLFTTVPVDPQTGTVAQAALLANFVQSAAKIGVKVWAVAGDPAAVKESEREQFSRFPIAYARYNREMRSDARLAGIQLDIEPYLNPGYGLAPASWQQAYIETLLQLKRAADIQMDVVVPFWWLEQQGGQLLERLAPIVDTLTVMNYRTEPTQIKRFAQAFLEWGALHKRPIRIALEFGPIPDEVQRHYRLAPVGDVAMIVIGSQPALVLFDRELGFPANRKDIQVFATTHTTSVLGGTVTFANRRQAVQSLLPELETLWSAWPSFAGVALHEFQP